MSDLRSNPAAHDLQTSKFAVSGESQEQDFQTEDFQSEPVTRKDFQIEDFQSEDFEAMPSLPQSTAGQPVAPRNPRHHQHGLLPAIQSVLDIIVTAIFIITFTVQPFRIPSGSMEPTLLVGDFLLVDKESLGFDEADGVLPPVSIRRGEIIVFHFPVDPSLHLIKRVIGVPGDHLRLHDGHVYINGQALNEPYAVYRPTGPDSFRDNFPHLQTTAPDIDPAWWIRLHTLIDHGELIVPTDNYFVLGDNRNDSEDSRYWGFVPRAAIVGKPVVIYFSLHQTDADAGDNESPDRSLRPANSASHSVVDGLFNFVRWNRIFRIVQ